MPQRKHTTLRPEEGVARDIEAQDDVAEEVEADRPARLLTRRQQREFIDLMRLGAPPLLGFQKVGITFEDMMLTIDEDFRFSAQLQQIHDILTTNVNSALYKAAMNGSVTAQTQFLRLSRQQPKPADTRRKRASTRKLKRMLIRAAGEMKKEMGMDEEE